LLVEASSLETYSRERAEKESGGINRYICIVTRGRKGV